MPLIYNGKIIAGDQRPVLTEVIEDSNYLVESKGIAEYVKKNVIKTVPDALSTDGINYTVSIPEITELYNGLEITVIPNMTSKVTNPTLKINNLNSYEIRVTSSNNSNASYYPSSKDFIKINAPLKLMFNKNKNLWITQNINRPIMQDISGYKELLARIEALEEAIGSVV